MACMKQPAATTATIKKPAAATSSLPEADRPNEKKQLTNYLATAAKLGRPSHGT